MQLPDIDMDFDERYRADVIRYAAEKYGSDHVAQIVTFSTIKGKQALRDAARVLGHPYSVGDRLAKAMPPPILGREAASSSASNPCPDDCRRETKDWHANAAESARALRAPIPTSEVVDVARGLEGPAPSGLDPRRCGRDLARPPDRARARPAKGEDAEIVTQYEMHGIETLGLLKMDFLGLRNLSIIERTLELIT